MKTLTEHVQICHGTSMDAGWWDEIYHLTPSQRVLLYSQKIALIHSETSEMLEGLRKGKADDHLPQYPAEHVEAADIFIRLADYCGARGIDLEKMVDEKLAYNAKRADHKREARAAEGGKKF